MNQTTNSAHLHGDNNGGADNGDAERKIVYLILGPKKPADARRKAVADRLSSEFRQAGWTVRNLRPRALSPQPRTGSRPISVLEPTDAHHIYSDAHRCPVAVVQIAAVSVLKKADSHPTPRNTMTLERFVRYKTCFIVASPEHDSDDAVHIAEDWAARQHCHDDADARCLPLHVFSPQVDWCGLDTGAAAFEAEHGRPSHRVDSQRRRWPKDLGNHGTPVDIVAGHHMQRGHHWDAQAGANQSFVYNASEVWTLKTGGHLNVYPDSHIRRGKNSGREYVSARPAEVLEDDTTPATPPQSRRRRGSSSRSRKQSRGRR